RGNVVQAQSQLSTTQAKWYEARITRAKLEHSIATLIGKAPADFSLDSAPIDVQVPEVPLVLPATLLKRRPDIAAAERRMAAASAQIGVAEAEAYPALNLFAGASIRKGLLGGAKVNAPLYAGGAIQARGAEASAAYTEVVANYRQTVLDSFREVEDDLITLQHLDKASEAMTEAVKASRETVKIMKNQYHAGIINYQSIVIAQATSLADERGALDVLSRRLVANVDLIKALGGGWDAAMLEPEEEQQAVVGNSEVKNTDE
ncbi:MAG TPA: RND transporter, partial [Gammaproteobacteria bacterium]|nr:RND transporter [Gammaproteobacteria bacterium]